MYSRSTNNSNTTPIIIGCVVIVLVVLFRPLLSTISLPVTYPGSWWQFTSTSSKQFPVQVYRMPDTLFPNTLLVQSDNELVVGKKIYTPQREFLGTITSSKKIGTHTIGWVELISGSKEKILVTLNLNGVITHLEARGRGQGVFVAQLPGVTVVEKGTGVTLSGSGDLLGQVVGTRSNQQDPFQRVFIAPHVQLRSLTGLLVE